MASATILGGCHKGDNLDKNPNVADDNAAINPSYIFNHISWELYQGGGVVDAAAGSVFEGPFDQVMRWNQYTQSNFSYYRGTNAYNWSVSATAYDELKYADKLEARGKATYGNDFNVYSALAKFTTAYQFIWLTQRVGDIPMAEAGNPANRTPAYDTQHDVYKRSLVLLDSANLLIAGAIKPNTSTDNTNKVVDGDIFGRTYGQWQKIINAYRLRVLISLSKRADDNADLNIKQQFSDIVSNPAKYPLLSANTDNLAFIYNSINQFPRVPSDGYNIYENIGATYLNLTTASKDPRTFVVATPAPAQITAGKTAGDFTAYVGADPNKTLNDLNTDAVVNGKYSFVSFKRYFASITGPESYTIIGYSEMCFNIAEAAARGWITADAATWYKKGIDASLAFYGITDGQSIAVGDVKGTAVGTATVNLPAFYTAVTYNAATGIQQILEQKYVAMFQNSGWEAYYNWRRTGYPAFAQGGAGIGTASNKIPRRWQYPTDETTYNSAHASDAIQRQYSGKDDVTLDTWLTK